MKPNKRLEATRGNPLALKLYVRPEAQNMTKLCSFLLIMTLGCGSIWAAETSDLDVPEIQMEQALALAKRHVLSEKIDVSESYIALAEWHPRSDLVGFWNIEWRTKKPVKGGRIIVIVYANGKIEHGFGE